MDTTGPQPLTLAAFLSLRYSAGGLPLTRLISQRGGALLAFSAARLGISPSAITLLGLAVFLAAAWFYAAGPDGIAAAVLCAMLFQFAYALDCADGQLARAINRTSAFGAWLDLACDYVRNIALAGATIVWLARSGIEPGTALAACGLQLAAMVVHLHTVTVLRQAGARPRPIEPGTRGFARVAATSALDTATVLLCLGLLRIAPQLLLAYAALLAAAYSVMTLVVVRSHFR